MLMLLFQEIIVCWLVAIAPLSLIFLVFFCVLCRDFMPGSNKWVLASLEKRWFLRSLENAGDAVTGKENLEETAFLAE